MFRITTWATATSLTVIAISPYHSAQALSPQMPVPKPPAVRTVAASPMCPAG